MWMNFRSILVLLFLTLLLASCGGKKRVVTTKKRAKKEKVVTQPKPEPEVVKESTPVENPNPSKPTTGDINQDYILDFKDAAMREMQLYKIPASITLAQGILESGAGRARLAQEANNHFGIKCHKGWTGGKIYHDDDEKGECFRTYNDATYSYRDHSLFLTERKRYRDLFSLNLLDYKAWARGLRQAGYATDRRYPEKLINLIERYELDQYDTQALEAMSVEDQMIQPPLRAETVHTVKPGETLYRISKIYNVSVEDLKRLNDLSSNTLSVGQVLTVK